MSLFLPMFLSLIITILLLSLSLIISKFSLKTKILFSPFECGFNPISSPRNSFSIQFFFIAILFLIFDVEIILLLPFPISQIKSFSFLSSVFFTLFILTLGLIYEQSSGALKWL